MTERRILGIWDGHDAGAAIVSGEDGRMLAAVNEERLSGRKLDIGFPSRSVESCLSVAGLSPDQITDVAYSTDDFAKTLSRAIPGMGRSYYMFRRRKTDRPALHSIRRYSKYLLTLISRPRSILRRVNEAHFSRILSRAGFRRARIHSVDHHAAHAASAYYPSGMRRALCITLDGLGDGLSGTVSLCDRGRIERISAISAADSVGIFYEQVTTILGMRELEDEGKVMSLAEYSHRRDNKLAGFFSVDGMRIRAKHDPITQYRLLERLAWRTPPEDFAKMAQDTLEATVLALFRNAAKATGERRICWAGGIASNIKLNQRIRNECRPRDWFVFPHMGDGGLAAGAALAVAGIPSRRKLDSVYFGPRETRDSVLDAASRRKGLKVSEPRDPEREAAGIMLDDDTFVLRFEGGMEFGPRALGNRTIAAPAASMPVKDELNLRIKERNWYQPFCPSMLENEACRLFSDYDGIPDRFMTMGYSCNARGTKELAAAIHVDRSGRPQMVSRLASPGYHKFISAVRRKTGTGAILNTSFNLHGDPIVCTIGQALDMMQRSGSRHMFAEGVHIERKG